MKTLEEIELFNDKTFRNVPTSFLLATLGICIFAIILSRIAGGLFTCVAVPFLFYLHRNDPHAIIIFFKSLSLSGSVKHGRDTAIKFKKV